MRGLTGGDGSDVLDAKSLSSARQEFVELRLGGPDNFALQHDWVLQPVVGYPSVDRLIEVP